jgi:selenide,water dikinase
MKNVKLTELSNGGGCGCKIEPRILTEILKNTINMPIPDELVVGIETSDDAAVYLLNETQALIATTDFFMPIVDDPIHFGAIAATNAISDVYAMGGKPILALAIVGMPISIIPTETISKILDGGRKICADAGIPIAGGHTIESSEPIYGLVVLGLVHPANIKKNSNAKIGDKLLLGKPIGMGIYSSALKKNALSVEQYSLMIKYGTQLNSIGHELSLLSSVSSITDVTGFGLAGHAWEMAKGCSHDIKIFWDKVPLLPGVNELVAKGFLTGASQRNFKSFEEKIIFGSKLKETEKNILFDPQTSGGLLVSVEKIHVENILENFEKKGFVAAEIGEVIKKNNINESVLIY